MNAELTSLQPVLRTSGGDSIDVVLEIASDTSSVISKEVFKRKKTGSEQMTKAEKNQMAEAHIRKILTAQTADKVWSGMAINQKMDALTIFLTDQTMNKG